MAIVNPRRKHRNTTLGLSTKYGQGGEITVDTDKNTAVVMDGTTLGGFPLAREDMSNVDVDNLDLSNNTTMYIGVDTGDVKASLASSLTGWILCNGQAVSRTTYAELFALIGENFGVGDGSTTFNIPDYRGAFLRGLDDGTLTAGNVYTKQLDAAPNITGQSNVWGSNSKSGALKTTTTDTAGLGSSVYSVVGNIGLDASLSSASYGRDSTTEVRPMNFAVNWFIKA